MNEQVSSAHFPYVPIHLQVRQITADVDALLDTGFDGDVVIPASFVERLGSPGALIDAVLADGSQVSIPTYRGFARVGGFAQFFVNVAAVGNEILVGRGVSDRFTIILDHGRQLIVEP